MKTGFWMSLNRNILELLSAKEHTRAELCAALSTDSKKIEWHMIQENIGTMRMSGWIEYMTVGGVNEYPTADAWRIPVSYNNRYRILSDGKKELERLKALPPRISPEEAFLRAVNNKYKFNPGDLVKADEHGNKVFKIKTIARAYAYVNEIVSYTPGMDVYVQFGGQWMKATVLEDRGNVGHDGRHLVRVKILTEGSWGAPPELEIPTSSVSIGRKHYESCFAGWVSLEKLMSVD